MILVIAGGEWRDDDRVLVGAALNGMTPEAVVCADSGIDHALTLGLYPTHLVGDLDSVSPEGRAWATANGVAVTEALPDKDETDLELALSVACGLDEGPLLVVDGGGGRLDHAAANLLVLASPRWAARDISALIGAARLNVVRGPGSTLVLGEPGSIVSILPVGADANGVVTEGLRWELHRETLSATAARGASNELVRSHGRVSLDQGTVLVIQPLAGQPIG